MNKFDEVFLDSKISVCMKDRDGKVIFQNKALREAFGGLNEKCHKVYEGKDELCEGCPVQMAFEDGKHHTSERVVTMPSGETAIWENTAAPIKDKNGNVIRCVEIARNITVKKNEENALRRLNDQLLAQQSTINELATPVIQIWDDILILPLIGTIDTHRAQQIIENLLDSIVKTQASMTIMDITGVPVVDTVVAKHLLSTINAARMLGAEVIVTGVSPHNAQTLVKLGVDLTTITTKGSLQAGLKLAFEMTSSQVSKR
jgi:rsbT co-antagonist protein RsbR